jgi:hypothetical protein
VHDRWLRKSHAGPGAQHPASIPACPVPGEAIVDAIAITLDRTAKVGRSVGLLLRVLLGGIVCTSGTSNPRIGLKFNLIFKTIRCIRA